jgi:formylglycine-generating enzyme required for sulfatase activity
MKGNWDKGIPMLALGKDGQTTKLAIKELEGVTDVAGQVTLGDGWWALAETKDGLARERLRERAAVWYRLASPKVSGLVKSKVEMRISEIPKERLERLSAPNMSPTRASPPAMAVAPFDARQAKEHQQAWAKHLGVPVETTNSIGMKLALIPPGEFDMGSTQEEVDRLLGEARQNNLPQYYIDRLPAEAPRHRARITRAFYLGVCEVTQAQYERVMGSNPSHFKESGPDAPVVNVSWDDAAEFCRRLSGMVEEKAAEYRLPTEAEWEYACRAGTTTRYHFGDDKAHLGAYAWWWNNSGRKTHPVGRKKSNSFGLHDVHGNALEWCQDRFAEDYYADSPPSDPSGAKEGSPQVVRGGSWNGLAGDCRSAFRYGGEPGRRFNGLGFRVARSPSGK